MVTDVGKVDDKSFNESGWNGAKQAAAELKGKADYIETKDSKDYATNIQSFLDKKYDIIVTSGFALTGATITAAKANPTIMFIGIDQFQEDDGAQRRRAWSSTRTRPGSWPARSPVC